MKPTQLEILFFPSTQFSFRQLREKYVTIHQNISTTKEKNENITDNGLLSMLYLPEVYKKLPVNRIMQAGHFLAVEYGEFMENETLLSINPHSFLGAQVLS